MAKSKKSSPDPIEAAGTVLYRCPDDESGDLRIAVIHRPHRGDMSLPKGKLERGELPAVAAFRETLEETGIVARLGRSLGSVHYAVPVGGKRRSKLTIPKVVHYWAGQAVSGDFAVNDEVDRLEWLAPDDAAAALSYDTDRDVLNRFLTGPRATHTLLLVRHARAGAKARWDGPDPVRPLDSVGVRQSAAMVPVLRAFGADTIYAADRVRCVDTVRPYAEEIGASISIEKSLTEESYGKDPHAAFDRLMEIAETPGVPAVCSQGKVIPFIVADWADRNELELPRTRSRKASIWVLSITIEPQHPHPKLVAADYYDSPLPV